MRLAVALLWVVGLHAADTVDLASDSLVAEGSAQFAKSCAVGYCHGSEGRSARGPALRDRVWDPSELFRITAEGLPGTSMPGWEDVLTAEAVWAVTAYVMSLSSEPPTGAAAIVELGAASDSPESPELSAGALRGKELFFDLTRERRCSVCHQLDGLGTPVGPNLKIAAKGKTPQELESDVLEPHGRIAFGFEQVQVELRSGETLAGVLAEETETHIRVFDAASVPPPLRSFAKADVRRQQTRARSSMPGDLDTVYTSDEIADIATYLSESAGGS